MRKANALTTLTFLSIAAGCFAQPIYAPVQNTIRTPYGNATYTTNQMVGYMPYNYGGTQAQISSKYKFTVVLKNDSSFVVKTRIDITGKKHFVKAKLKKKKIEITPDQTKEISRESYMAGRPLVGIPADTCWLFLSIQGKISAYSYLAEVNSEYLIAVKKYDGPIVKISKVSLKEMMEGDEKAIKYLEKNRYKQAIEEYNRRK